MQGPQGPYGHNPYHAPAAPMVAPPFQCRACGHVGHAAISTKISTNGWIVFAIMLFLCLPFCWIPLLGMKERKAVCPQCRVQAV
jgi:uncharacterized membrane protein